MMSSQPMYSSQNMTPAQPQDLYMTPAPQQDLASSPAAPQISSQSSTPGYTVQSGDTLSGIAQRNNMSLNDVLDLNPQYRANPNLIRPGDTISFGAGTGTQTQIASQPTAPTAPTMQTSTPAASAPVYMPPTPRTDQAPPRPTDLLSQRPQAPQAPQYEPFSSQQYQDAYSDVERLLQLSPEEVAAQNDLIDLQSSFKQAYQGEADRPIPLEFITGRQESLENRALNLAEPIQQRLALAQNKRLGALDASKFALEQMTEKEKTMESRRQFDVGTQLTREQLAQQREQNQQDYQLLERKFQEDVRQFGMNYALDQFQVGLDERGISLDEAQFYADQAGEGGMSPYQAERAQRVVSTVDDLMSRVNNWTVGRGAALQELGPDFLASGRFRDFRADLDELSANIAFNELTAMREASKTGGALGQVSERELALLQSALGGLRQDQTPEGFKNNLTQIKESIERWNNAMQQYGGGGGSGTISTPDGLQWRQLPDGSYEEVTFSHGGGGTPIASSGMRTDRHNNPAAFTTDIARQAGLREGVDYEIGDPFPNNPNQRTARLLGDPVATTIRVIDNIGFYTGAGQPRWTHTAMSQQDWSRLSFAQKANVVNQMYQREGGNALKPLFSAYA